LKFGTFTFKHELLSLPKYHLIPSDTFQLQKYDLSDCQISEFMSQSKASLFKGNFVLVFLASLLMFTAFYILLPTLPVFLTSVLMINEGRTGIILSAFTIAALLIRPFTGFLIDRFGRKPFYIPAILFFALTFLCYPLAGTLTLMIMVRLMHGLVWGVATTTGSTLIVDIVPAERRGEGIGLYGLAMTIPMALGPMAGIQLSENNNFLIMFVCAAIMAFAGFLLTLPIKYPSIQQADVKFSWKNLLESSSLPVTLNLLMVNIGYGGMVSFISLYALKTNIGNVGIYFIVFAVGITLARLYMGKIFDRYGPKLLSISGISLLAAGFLILGTLLTIEGFMMAAFVLGLGSGIVFPVFQAMVNNLVPAERRGAANSTLFSGLDLGIGLGMLITGFMAHAFGLPHTFLFYALLNIAALIYFLTVSLPHYHRNRHTMPG
jgi:MFS family permease